MTSSPVTLLSLYMLFVCRASSTSSLNSAGLLGTAERTFLTPKNQQEEVSSNIPSLDEFDAEIEIYRVCLISQLRSYVSTCMFKSCDSQYLFMK